MLITPYMISVMIKRHPFFFAGLELLPDRYCSEILIKIARARHRASMGQDPDILGLKKT